MVLRACLWFQNAQCSVKRNLFVGQFAHSPFTVIIIDNNRHKTTKNASACPVVILSSIPGANNICRPLLSKIRLSLSARELRFLDLNPSRHLEQTLLRLERFRYSMGKWNFEKTSVVNHWKAFYLRDSEIF